jgi:uncharacterized protein (TIGR03435 family)
MFTRLQFILVATLFGLAVSPVIGSQKSASAVAEPAKQPRVIPLADRIFDAVSVKSNRAGNSPGVINNSPTRLTLSNMALVDMIAWAYRVDAFRVVDGPSWIRDEHFDLVGTADPKAGSYAEFPDMVQKALAERFGLKAHREDRRMDVYVLSVFRPDGVLGPQLKRSTIDCTPTTTNRPPCFLRNGPTSVEAVGRDWSQINLTQSLRWSMGEMVVDRTGLTGKFDATLNWTVGVHVNDSATDQVSVFTALREQLGLQLVRDKLPIQVVAIDSVERLHEN